MTTRRQFLAGCSVLTFAAGLAPSALLAAPTETQSVALHEVSYDFFARQLGATFTVSQKSAPDVRLKLVEARLTPARDPRAHLAEDARNEKFSLLFRGPVAAALPQNTHTFAHADLGRFAMFIVPVRTSDANHAYYEAVFNRLAPVITI